MDSCRIVLAITCLLTVNALSQADEPAPSPNEPLREALPLPPVAPQLLPTSYTQTIDWLRRPTPSPAKPADGVVPAAIQQVDPAPVGPPHNGDLFRFEVTPSTTVAIEGLLRGYYRNDQRIEWSGLEETFGAEGVLRPSLQTVQDGWIASAQAEFFLNEPYGSSILSDPRRDLYRANFRIEPFEIFQLFGQVQYDDWTLRLGKSRTPFGGYYSPMFTNSLMDAPFIRTEVIQWTETGIFLHYEPGLFVGDVAIVNGEPNLDTNSSKGIIARVGLNQPGWTIGTSVKWQDGISSEQQKRYNSVVGLDWAVRSGRFVVYGETMYDQYGFWRNFDRMGNPLNLGIRSLYHRDVYSGRDQSPLNGIGYYVAAGYHGVRWLVDLSFGSYFPQDVGIPAQDVPIHRGVMKVAFAVTPNFQLFSVGLVENTRPPDGVLPNDRQFMVLSGMQLAF